MRAIALPDEIRRKALAEVVSDTGRLDPVSPREGLGCPWGTELMVPPRDLRAPSLVIDAEFVHACALGEMLEFDLWVKRLGRSSFDLALAGAVKGELRLCAAWTLCTISFATMKSVPLPDDLRAGMERFLAG
jgi:4-hydroxybenzoyl-CoA thioesterase